MTRNILLVFLLFLFAPLAHAYDETQLYDPLPPEGSAFVRTFNNEVSPYIETPETEAFKAGKFYTQLNGMAFEDPVSDNRAKASLVFYNLTDHEKLSLKTADGQTAIIEDIAPFTNGGREVNAVSLSMAAFTEERQIAELEEKVLTRGSAYPVFAIPGINGGEAELLFVRSETGMPQQDTEE